MSESRLQAVLAVLPIVSGGLYLLGFAHHQGYLDAFGIDDSLFQLATDRSLLLGFYAALGLILLPSFYTLCAVFFYSLQSLSSRLFPARLVCKLYSKDSQIKLSGS
jgi:hypothetical protein